MLQLSTKGNIYMHSYCYHRVLKNKLYNIHFMLQHLCTPETNLMQFFLSQTLCTWDTLLAALTPKLGLLEIGAPMKVSPEDRTQNTWNIEPLKLFHTGLLSPQVPGPNVLGTLGDAPDIARMEWKFGPFAWVCSCSKHSDWK